MANLPESSVYEAGIRQLETSDPVQGGADGVANTQAKQLANRTRWLKEWQSGHDPTLNGHSDSDIAAAAHGWVTGASLDAQLTALVNGLAAQVAPAGAARVGNEAAAYTQGSVTVTAPAGTLASQVLALATRLAQHAGHALPGDHDGRYLRPIGTSDAATITAGSTADGGSASIGSVGPPPVSVYYLADTTKWYLAGTGPRAADLEVWWVYTGPDWDLKIKNVGATSIDVRFGGARFNALS